MKRIVSFALVITAVSVLVAFNNSRVAEAVTTSLVPFTTAGDQGNNAVYSSYVSTSTDGRYVAFDSKSSNLTSNDTNLYRDAFMRDTVANQTILLSAADNGSSVNQGSINDVKITGNARYALITTQGKTLVTGANDGSASSVYLRDIKAEQTHLISAGSIVTETSNTGLGLSEDGRFIYYFKSINLPSASRGLYQYDRKLSTERRIDLTSSGLVPNGQVYGRAGVSCDGRYIAFASVASDLISSDTNGVQDVFLVDTHTGGVTKNITQNGNGISGQGQIKLTCDGNYIFFVTNASNLASGDNNGGVDILKYSVANETFEIVSKDASGNQYGDNYIDPDFDPGFDGFDASLDGRYVVFNELKYKRHERFGIIRQYSRIVLRDTRNNSNQTIESNGYTRYPVINFDGTRVYYMFTDVNTSVPYKLYTATDYL